MGYERSLNQEPRGSTQSRTASAACVEVIARTAGRQPRAVRAGLGAEVAAGSVLSIAVSDYDVSDGRPVAPLVQCTVSEAVYVFHDAGLVGLEVGTYGVDGRNPETSVVLGLTIDQARHVARELNARADEVGLR